MISGESMDDGNTAKKVDYENFEDLKSFDEIYDFDNKYNEIISNICNEQNWLNQFESLNDLRRLNKFDLDLFNKVFPQVVGILAKLTASIRSNLSKLSIMLIKEIFNNNKISREVMENLKLLISSVLAQSGSMKLFIKEECQASLDKLSSNMTFYSPHTVAILINEISNKSLQSSENAFNTLVKILKNWSREDIFSGTDSDHWENICHHIINIYLLKREPYSKRACRLIDIIYNKFGEEDFNSLMGQFKMNQTNKNLISAMIKEADTKKKGKPTESIRDFMSKNKQK